MDFSSLALMKTLGQSQSLASHQSLAGLLQELLESTRSELEASACGLYLLEPEGWVCLRQLGELSHVHGWLPGEALLAAPKIQRDLEHGGEVMLHPLGKFCLLARGAELQKAGLSTLQALQVQIHSSLSQLHQLARLQAESAQHQQALVQRSAHLGSLSHQLRTPLNAVLGFCQLLTRNPETTTSQLEGLRHIQDNGTSLLEMLGDVVEVSRLEANQVTLKKEPFELQALLRDLEASLALAVTPGGRELAFQIEGPRQLLGDAERLTRLLRQVVLASSRLSERGQIRLTQSYQAEQGLHFEILDQGAHPDQSVLEALFDPFTHPGQHQGTSTGLELLISRHYAALMDGWVRVSREPEGLLWTIQLRLPESEADGPSALSQLDDIQGLHPDQPEIRILVVDDVIINRFLLTSFLQPLGFALREAEDGAKAVEAFREWNPHVILMDLIMPNMSGREAIEKIRRLENGGRTLIVAVSGNEEEAVQVDSNAHLHKPVQLDQLLRILHNHLNLRFQYRSAAVPDELELALVPSSAQLIELARAARLGDVTWVESLLTHLAHQLPEHEAFWKLCRDLARDFHFGGLAASLPPSDLLTTPPDHRPTVLLVDDNPTNLKILFGALAALECRCLVAQSGEEALRIARQTRPTVVLLDVLMPGWDGFETLRRLQNDSRAETPSVIFLSALSDTSDKVRGLKEGAADYISKPFHPEEVVARVRLQLALRSLQAQLRLRNHELAKSNQQKNELLGMAAHDLRNPLAVITGYAAILERGLAGALEEKSKTLVNNIHSTGKEMQVLLEDLLSVSQIEAGHLHLNLQPADPKALFQSCIQLQNFQASAKEITLHSQVIAPVPASLPLDASKIKQAFTNLLSNAIKFSKPHTTIQARLLSRDGSLIWEVEDQGPGIPTQDLDKLFQPFQRTSVRATAGERSTGLGLAITKRILEGHHGRISVDSQVGRGTTFALIIPLN